MNTLSATIRERISVLTKSLLDLRTQFEEEPDIYDVYSQSIIWELGLLKEKLRTLSANEGVDHLGE